MTANASYSSYSSQLNIDSRFQMAKRKSIMVLISMITFCCLIFSLTDAYPTEVTPTSYLENVETSSEHSNSSHLVITHVVKTLEFEVDLVDDDGENSTESDTSTPFVETDIKLLDVSLLRQIVVNSTGNSRSGSGTSSSTAKPGVSSNIASSNDSCEERSEETKEDSLS